MRARLLAATLLATGLSSSAFGPAFGAETAPPPPGCASPEHHQFDFWIGEWNVSDTKTGQAGGASIIESLYGGCGIRENWSDPQITGGSLNIYDNADHRWHQFWIDSSGARREFIGGLDDSGKMVLVAHVPSVLHPELIIQVRMILTANPDGSVEQVSDMSRDNGVTWVPRYDYTYRKK